MLERFQKSINELVKKRPDVYETNISDAALPIYFETARLYDHLSVDVVAKTGGKYEVDGQEITLEYPNVVRIRISEEKRFGEKSLRQDYFEQVRIMKQKIENNEWSISIDTHEKVQSALAAI